MAATADRDETTCRIYALLDAGAGAEARLAALLEAHPLTSLLILPTARHPLTAALVKPLVDLAQAKGCAALLADDAALARTLRADGVHLGLATGSEPLMARYAEARSILGSGAIIGADVGCSRHDAMEIAEAGADYVGFSPAEPIVTDPEDEIEPMDRDELVAWWSEVFEVPCVAFGVETINEAAALAASGAEFVSVRFAGGETVAAAVDRMRAVAAAMEATHAA